MIEQRYSFRILLSELLLKVKMKVVGAFDLREITLPGFLLLLLKLIFNLKRMPERDAPAANKRKNGENETAYCRGRAIFPICLQFSVYEKYHAACHSAGMQYRQNTNSVMVFQDAG